MSKELRPKGYYFNLTYACNSDCIFCASDNVKKAVSLEIKYAKVVKALKGLKKVDSVIFNGGEPTLYKKLPTLLEIAKKAQAATYLFTNGRMLADIDYAREIINRMIGIISVPLYGMNPETHDYFTGAAGSFAQTIAGIKNVLALKKKRGFDIGLEVKLLFAKPLLKINPRIPRFLSNEITGRNYTISLNSLLISQAVIKHKRALIPKTKELTIAIRKTLVSLSKGKFSLLCLNVPSCIIPKKFLPILKTKSCWNKKEMRYFDPHQEQGSESTFSPTTLHTADDFQPQCNACMIKNDCFFPVLQSH